MGVEKGWNWDATAVIAIFGGALVTWAVYFGSMLAEGAKEKEAQRQEALVPERYKSCQMAADEEMLHNGHGDTDPATRALLIYRCVSGGGE